MIINRSQIVLPRLDHQVAVVTGAGRGIGRETAQILAHLGATTIIAEEKESGLETEELIRRRGGAAHYIRTDVSDEASVTRLRDEVMAVYGRVDILVNNATVFTVGPLLIREYDELNLFQRPIIRRMFQAGTGTHPLRRPPHAPGPVHPEAGV